MRPEQAAVPTSGRGRVVSERRSPTIRRRRLGAELRRQREAAGITIEAVAEQLECSASKVSRIETGHTTATPRDVRDMLRIYGVVGAESDELVQIAREARQKGWWHPYSTVLVGAYVGLEAAAGSIRAYEQQVVPGLLETEEYAGRDDPGRPAGLHRRTGAATGACPSGPSVVVDAG